MASIVDSLNFIEQKSGHPPAWFNPNAFVLYQISPRQRKRHRFAAGRLGGALRWPASGASGKSRPRAPTGCERARTAVRFDRKERSGTA
jgi:hypothetical protein